MQKCRAGPGTSIHISREAFKDTLTVAGVGIVDSHQRDMDDCAKRFFSEERKHLSLSLTFLPHSDNNMIKLLP